MGAVRCGQPQDGGAQIGGQHARAQPTARGPGRDGKGDVGAAAREIEDRQGRARAQIGREAVEGVDR